MTGLPPFKLDKSSDNFIRSFKKIQKSFPSVKASEDFVKAVGDILVGLTNEPRPTKSRQEPCPRKFELPEDWEFRKIEFTFAKGASGQIRIMYFFDTANKIIKPIWIYSHEQFSKRPADKDLTNIMIDNLIIDRDIDSEADEPEHDNESV
jgi:hypothetical protein